MSDKDSGITFCIGNVQVWIHFEWRDMWIGVYWDRDDIFSEVYICILPMLPIRFLWPRAVHGCRPYLAEPDERHGEGEK